MLCAVQALWPPDDHWIQQAFSSFPCDQQLSGGLLGRRWVVYTWIWNADDGGWHVHSTSGRYSGINGCCCGEPRMLLTRLILACNCSSWNRPKKTALRTWHISDILSKNNLHLGHSRKEKKKEKKKREKKTKTPQYIKILTAGLCMYTNQGMTATTVLNLLISSSSNRLHSVAVTS